MSKENVCNWLRLTEICLRHQFWLQLCAIFGVRLFLLITFHYANNLWTPVAAYCMM